MTKPCATCGKPLHLLKDEPMKVYCSNECYRIGTKDKKRGV